MAAGEVTQEREKKMADEKKSGGGMTVREAGRKGGQKVRDERGHAFYQEIGRKGGETVRDQRGHEFYEEIGHKGGQKVKELIAAGKRRAAEEAEKASVEKKSE
jgi:general stress protein YciG